MNNLKQNFLSTIYSLRFCLFLFFIIEGIPIFAQGSLAEARQYYKNNEYTKAIPLLKIYAEQGNAEAQYDLGTCYKYGLGVNKDEQKTFFWIEKAAKQNYVYAQYALGICYFIGCGITEDETKAIYWIEKAAKQNLAKAQHSLGWCYAGGHGVTRDYKKAEFWFRKAADKGFSAAKEDLEKLLSEQSNYRQEQINHNTIASNTLDENIPITNQHAENTFAVIIGNENYQWAINVPYAENDAKTFAAYCEKTLGLPKQNIRVYTNATYGTMVNAISKIKDIATVYQGKLNILFYYSGHGIPNENTYEAFLLPTDAD